jgi:hypothetical protein
MKWEHTKRGLPLHGAKEVSVGVGIFYTQVTRPDHRYTRSGNSEGISVSPLYIV